MTISRVEATRRRGVCCPLFAACSSPPATPVLRASRRPRVSRVPRRDLFSRRYGPEPVPSADRCRQNRLFLVPLAGRRSGIKERAERGSRQLCSSLELVSGEHHVALWQSRRRRPQRCDGARIGGGGAGTHSAAVRPRPDRICGWCECEGAAGVNYADAFLNPLTFRSLNWLSAWTVMT